MKQILCRILVLLVVVAAILGLSSCNIFIEQDVTFYDLVVNDFDREVVYGSELDFSGLEIEATTGDDVKYIPVNSSMIVSGDTKTVGAHELEIEYGGFSWTLAYEVFYKVEHIVDGLVYDSQLVSSRDEILYVKDPVKNGSIFLGWSTDMPETLTGNVRREAVFVDNITLPKLSATYGDTLGDITLPTVSGGKWHWQDSAETSVGNAGTNVFKLVYVFDDTTKGELTFDVDVEVAKKHVDIKVLDEVFEYNGKVNTVRYELSEAVPAEDVICFGDIAGTEIGEYSYTIRIFNDNYEGQYSGTFEIEPIDITIAILLLDPSDGVYKSEVIIDYGNSFPEYKIVITDKNGNDYKLDAELSVSKPILLKAGEHPVTTSFDDEHYDPKIIGATLKVNTVDLDPGVPGLIGAENVVFGDKLSEILFEEHQLGYWEWDLSHGDTVGNAGKNTFTAVFVPKDSSYNEYRYDVELTVNRKQLTFDITSSRTFVFDGKEYGLTYNVIDPNSREVVSGLKVLGNQKFVNAGTHSVTLEFEDKNYQAIENTFTFTISQATIEKDFSFIVDDVWFQGITLSDIPLPEGYKWNNPGIQIGEPGGYSYDATFYPEDQNYATVSGSLAIVLDKATPSLTTDKKAYDSLIYNTSEHKLSGVITHNSNSDMRNNIEYYISGTDEQITGLTNAGTYNIDVVVPESNKYKSAKVSVVVVVNKANPSIDRPVIDGWTFGDEADEPTSGSKQVEIAGFHYYTEECGQYTKLDGVPTNAGTYYVTAYSLATDNYNAAESDYRQFVIEKFVVTRPTLAHDVYTGGTLSATVPASTLYKVSENGNPARMNAGTYEVTLELLDSDNYIWNNGDKLTTKVSYVIDKATINLSAITGSNSFKYDDAFDFLSEKTYTTEHVTNFGEVVYLYATINNPTVFTEVVPENIGTYLVKAVVYADEANNWKTVETAPFRFEITKRPIPVPELSETTSVFNGYVFKPTAPENEKIYTIEYENENSINKGEYKVTFTIIDQNYKWADGANGERTYTITAATPKIYDVVSGGWTFGTPITHSASAKVTADGHEDYLINVENAVRVVYYNISNKNVPINKPSNAGTYYVRFVVSADNKNGNWVSTSSDYIEFVIEQFALDIPELDGTGVYTFTGSDIPLTVKENNAHKAHYTVSGNVERNVGSYTAVYSLENSNYKWNDETTADKTIDYKIQQAGSSVTDLAITSWTFNDAANIPVYTAKTSTGYTIPAGQISISFRKADSDSWTTISPSEWATKGPHYAGDYYVKVSVASDENNNWATSESTEFKLNIAKDDYDMSGVSWNYTSPFTFNDADHTVSVTGTLPSGVSVKEYTGNVEENAGTYTANVKFSYDSDNYNEPTLASLEWTINPQIVNKPEADTTEFVYNTTEQKYVLATHSGYTISGNLQTNAGTHTVTVTLNNEEIVNYKWNDGTYTAKTYDFVISPKALETTFVTLANTLEYNETAQTQTVLVKFGKEVLELDEDYFVTGNVQTDAGENYKLTVTAKAGSNYTGSVDIPYTVARKPIPKPSAATGLAFNNGTLDSGIYTIEGQWTAVDTAEAATVNGVTPAGDYKVTVTLNSNYKWNDGSITPLELPYKIDKATIKLTNLTAQYPEGASSWTFNDTIAYKATSDKTFVESEIKYLYSKSLDGTYTEDFIFDKATTYYVMAQVDAGDNWYVASTAPVQFKINQMPVPVPSVNTIPVYAQGTTYELIDILTNFDSSIMSFEEGSVTSSDVAGGFNAKVVLDANYVWESTFDGNISWSVSKAPASITIENAIFNKDYRVAGYSIYDIVSGITGNHSEVDPDYSIKTFGDANTYTVTVTLAESANYFSAESKDITIIINPIDTPDVISGLVATYGDLLSSVSLETYDDYGTWEWIETSGTTVGEVGERTFKAKFTPHTNESGTTNYKAISEKPLTVTVGQKGIFVPYVTAGQTFTYKLHDDDKNHTPNLTIPTLVMGDEAVNVYRIEGLTNSTAKTHEVIVTLINDNYKWNDGAEGTTRTFTYTINPYKITIPKVEDKPYADGADINSGLGSGVSGEYTVEDDPVGTTAGELLTVVLKLVDSSNTEWYNFYNVTNAVVYGDNSEYVKITYKIATATNEWVNGKEPAIDAEMTYGTATVDRPEVLHGDVKMEYKLKSATQWIEIPEGENLPADLSVGKYHIRFTSTDESASKLQEALDFTIVAAPATINVTNGLGTGGIYLTEGYDLSKITAKATANVGGAEIDVAIYLNGEKVESLGTVYAVDTYEVVFKLANDNYSAAEQSVTVEITKAPLTVPAIDNLDYAEVIENQKPVVTLDFDESFVEEITNVGGINVGEYKVIIKLTADAFAKYKWGTLPANATLSKDEKTVTITYNIKKVTNSFTYADGYNAGNPLSVEGWIYDNKANSPVGITGSAFGEVEYQHYKKNTATGEYEPVGIKDVKHAGDYQIVAYVEANGNNYDRIESKPVDFTIYVRTITPPTFTLNLPEGQTKFVYNAEKVYKPNVTESADKEYYSYTFGNEGNKNAGTYNVIVSINEEHVGSVVWAENAITDFPYTVDKAPVPTPKLTNSTVYTGSTIYGTYTPSNLYSSLPNTEDTTYVVGATDADEVGSLTFKLSVPSNYRWENDLTVENGLTGTEETTVVTFTITPAPVDAPTINGTYVYGESKVDGEAVVNSHEIKFNNYNENYMSNDAVVQTQAGSYKVTIELTDRNHVWSEGTIVNDDGNVELTWTIATDTTNKVNIYLGDDLAGQNKVWTYGDQISYSASHKYGTLDVVYTVKETGELAVFENGTLSAGTYIATATLIVEEHTNYNGCTGFVEFTVEAADSEIGDIDLEDWVGANVNLTFGAESNPTKAPELPEVNANDVSVTTGITIWWARYEAVATVSEEVTDPYEKLTWYKWTDTCYPQDAGSYIVKVEVDASEGRYKAAVKYFAESLITIDPAVMPVPAVTDKVFNLGIQNSGIYTVEGQWTVDDTAVAATVNGVTPAGKNYTVTVTLNSNYVWGTTTATNVTIVGQVATFTYNINPKALTAGDVSISLSGNDEVTYNGEKYEYTVTVTDGTTKLAEWDEETQTGDYTVTYSRTDNVSEENFFKYAGTITVTVTGKGNYSGTITKTYIILQKSIEDADVTVALTNNNLSYTGDYQNQSATVKIGDKDLTIGTDFTVTGDTSVMGVNTEGDYSIIVAGTGNYTGTVTKTFNVGKATPAYTYTTNLGRVYGESGWNTIPVVTIKGVKDEVLATLTYSGDVVITGKGEYTFTYSYESFDSNYEVLDEITLTVKVSKNTTVGTLDESGWTNVGGEYGTITYPTIKVNVGVVEIKTGITTYYAKANSDGTAPAADSNAWTTTKPTTVGKWYVKVSVDGTNDYDAFEIVSTESFEITTKYVTAPSWPNDTQPQYTFGDTFTVPVPTNSADKDYYTVTGPGSSTNAGTYTYVVTLKSEHGANIVWATGTVVNASNQVELSYKINPLGEDVPNIGDKIFNNGTQNSGLVNVEGKWTVVDTAVTATVNGVTPVGDYTVTVTLNGNYKWNAIPDNVTNVTVDGQVATITYKIDPKPIESVVIPDDTTYNGVGQKPDDVTVTVGKVTLTENTDYTVSYKRGDAETTDFTNAGTITVIVTGTGNYTGTIKKTYNINKAEAELTGLDGSYSVYANKTEVNEQGQTVKKSLRYIDEVISLDEILSLNDITVTVSGTTISNPVFTLSYKHAYKENDPKESCENIYNAGYYELVISLNHQNYKGSISVLINVAKGSAKDVLIKRLEKYGSVEKTVYYESLLGSLVNDDFLTWEITTTFAEGANMSYAKFHATVDDSNLNYASGPYTIERNPEKGTGMTFYTVARLGDFSTGTPYGTVEAALGAATSGTTVWIMPISNLTGQIPTGYNGMEGSITITSNTTIKSGVTLVLPHSATGGRNDGPTATSTSTGLSNNVVTILKLAEGTTITVNGTLEIAGILSGSSGGGAYAGHTTDSYAVLELGKNAKVKIEKGSNNAAIYCYGFITEEKHNNGSQVVLNAGTIYQPFTLLDFYGGGQMAEFTNQSALIDSGHNLMGKYGLSPFHEFQFRNVHALTVINNGARFKAWANLGAVNPLNDQYQQNCTEVKIIGASADTGYLVNIAEGGYLTFKYDKTTGIQDLDFYGGGELNEMTLGLSIAGLLDVNLSTGNVFFPISWAFDISLNPTKTQKIQNNTAYYVVNGKMQLMWGSKLTVESGASLEIVSNGQNNTNTSNSGTLYIHEDWNNTHHIGLSQLYGNEYDSSVYGGNRYNDALVIVRGELKAVNIAGKVYSDSVGASVKVTGNSYYTMNRITAFNAEGLIDDATVGTLSKSYLRLGKFAYTECIKDTDGNYIPWDGNYVDNGGYYIKPVTYMCYKHTDGKYYIVEKCVSDENGNYSLYNPDYKIQGSITIPTLYNCIKVGGVYVSIDNQLIIKETVNTSGNSRPKFYDSEQDKWVYGFMVKPQYGEDVFIATDTAAGGTHSAPSLGNPSARDYYTFDPNNVWYLDPEFKTAYPDTLTIPDSYVIIVYSKWSAIEYDIIYDNVIVGDHNAPTLPSNGKFTADSTNITPPTVTDDELTLLGTYLDAACTIPLKSINGSDLVSYLVDGKVTIYYKWAKETKYSFTFEVERTGGISNEDIGNALPDDFALIWSDIVDDAVNLPEYASGYDSNSKYEFKGWKVTLKSADGSVIKSLDSISNFSEIVTVMEQEKTTDVIITAVWNARSFTITVTTNNASVKVNGTAVANNSTISIQYGTNVTVDVTYSKDNSKSTTITGADETPYTSPFAMPAQEVKIHATSSGGGCVTGDTLVTLADGTQKRVDALDGTEMLLVWDFYKGEYTVSPVGAIVNHGYDMTSKVTMHFADGSTIITLQGHGFYVVAENKFVIIDRNNVADYVGHEFVKYDAEGNETTTVLVDYSIEDSYEEVWTLVSAIHFNCILNGVLTLSPTDFPDSPAYLMPFEIGEGMKYDEEKMQADIEKYGLYTYEEFAEYCTYEQFVGLNFANWKVAVGKGYITFDEIIYLIRSYLPR